MVARDGTVALIIALVDVFSSADGSKDNVLTSLSGARPGTASGAGTEFALARVFR